jgi:hypothetical protein
MEITKPTVKLIGTDGNVFSIIGKVSRALKQAGQETKAKEFCSKAMNAKSYDEVLQMMFDYVEVK